MAGLGRKVFAAGDILTAAQVQGYLQDQTIMVFSSSGARGSAIPSPSQSMFAYLTDDSTLYTYNGFDWAAFTSGGGGGGGRNSGTGVEFNGGNGGSGRVIVRYVV
jgi:hypothetical protein